MTGKFSVMTTSLTQLPPVKQKLLLLFLLCLCYQHLWKLKLVSAVAVTRNDTARQCTVNFNNTKVEKRIGSIWVSTTDPCAIHSCEEDNNGLVRELITTEDCSEFYCDVDSEPHPQPGTCCGVCMRTKCHYNNTIYDMGQMWHNKNDCTILECAKQPDGQSKINSFQKNCPTLPLNCAADDIYIEDCCKVCRSKAKAKSSLNNNEDSWTEEFYKNHPCVRECRLNEPPKTCQYNFVVEWYQTLSKACFNCPQNATDCQRPHCIVSDGIARSITIVNRMMPGPAIEVCENDIIVVDVQNQLLGESTTIHWHGLHQKSTPYMDGVPHITQCPISPHSTFRYTFKADNSGTHFWHSHTGMQRGDGVFGSLIIRRPRITDPHAHLYDFDLSEHVMIVQDWVHVPGVVMFADHHHSRGDNKPRNLLVNGRGRYYYAIWDQVKAEQKKKMKIAFDVKSETTSAPQNPKSTAEASIELYSEVEIVTPIYNGSNNYNNNRYDIGLVDSFNMENSNQTEDTVPKSTSLLFNPLSKQTQFLKFANSTSTDNISINLTTKVNSSDQNNNNDSHNRTKRNVNDNNIPLDEIPLQIFNVRQGFRYRFRIINAEFLNCPIMVSIDNHTLLAINSDSYDFEPIEVGSIVTYAGERFDFIVHANQTIGNYWVRFKGLMDCSEKFTSAFQVAILRYEGANNTEPSEQLGYNYKPEGIELNVMNRGSGYDDSLTIAEVNGLKQYDSEPGVSRDALKPVADYKFFVYYDFYAKDNPVYHLGDYYGIDANLTDENRVFTPQLNHISLKFPSVALLSERYNLDDSIFCNESSLAQQNIDCREEFCKCHHMLQVPLKSIVEIIIVDEGFTYDANHPFHLHGNAFRVVGLERLGTNVTIEMVKQLDRYNLLKRNLVDPPVKDTVTIPDGGYTIIRFEAYNPGFWLFHCHIEFHAEIGMALIFKVGNNDEMEPIPKNFPSCHDYMPNAEDDDNIKSTTKNNKETTTQKPIGGNDSVGRNFSPKETLVVLFSMIFWHTLIKLLIC
ncbi:uncharacterized protein LOC119687869 [Teleopsis dalmanni]|uniref:uncharacterized protein LOC119687869 n=1 Tax=Teleopsis dalmanni TaxID=139649 RepID=UPI0018CF9BC0|nr:uncharacterized protein LOC119687869 [Teleopsis dalmanni]XP_037958324.1 uncharacterized protein LOC119687869 [Teleopsis dalmanni]